VVVGERQQREEAGTLDCAVELTLVVGLGASQSGRNDLAIFLDEITQGIEILVIDLINASRAEAAELAALEERILLGELLFFRYVCRGMPS